MSNALVRTTALSNGRYNAGAGLLAIAIFMAYGFLLIYLRDFHPEKEAWIASYAVGKHFEARLAHVHGNLFGLLNVMIAFVLAKIDGALVSKQVVAWLSLLGLLMPVGILLEVYLGASPIFVLLGAAAMVAAIAGAGMLALKHWAGPSGRPT